MKEEYDMRRHLIDNGKKLRPVLDALGAACYILYVPIAELCEQLVYILASPLSIQALIDAVLDKVDALDVDTLAVLLQNFALSASQRLSVLY